MNRLLVVPAGCCLVAFAALLATLYAAGPDSNDPRGALANSVDAVIASDSQDADRLRMSDAEAKQALTAVADAYMRPWHEWRNSPRRLYSRAAPRPVPTLFAKVEVAPSTARSSDSFVLGTITIEKGSESETLACVVEPKTRRVQIFAHDAWLDQDAWLVSAPLP